MGTAPSANTLRAVRRPSWVWIAAVVVWLGSLVPHLGVEIWGQHANRQFWSAANIEVLLLRGLSTTPRAFHDDQLFAVFEFPLYPYLVAAWCAWTGSAALLSARCISLSFLIVGWLALDRTVARWGGSQWQRGLCLVFLLLAPLTSYYGPGVFSDPMCLGLSLVALCAWSESLHAGAGPRRAVAVGVWFFAGAVCTAVKSPIYLPVVFAAAAVSAVRSGWRSLVRPLWLAHGTALVVALVGARRYAERANADWPGWSQPGHEWDWYFSSWAERIDPDSWAPIALSVANKASTPFFVPLALVGLVASARRWREPLPLLALAWTAGALVTLAIFFGLHARHDYYQMIFLPPLALLATMGAPMGALTCWRAAGMCRLAMAGAIGAVVLAAAWHGAGQLGELRRDYQQGTRRAGAFVRQNSTAADYVFYVTEQSQRDPERLYYARRFGLQVPEDMYAPAHATAVALGCLADGSIQPDAAVLLFLPSSLGGTAQPPPPPWRLHASDTSGELFVFDP
ncbi:MAG: hypothetical protein GC161_11095 [Planctomycetaceae bacterium]|nr:hypothetical protein [Planctomycetaceae bacterium]